MSRNRKNNHYHFAEQYTDGAYRRRVRASRVMHLPRRAVFFAVLVLIVFGVITTTFSANNTEAPEDNGALIVKVRNTKATNDYVANGMDREEALALTGANVDYASVAAVTDLRYNSNTKGWGTSSTVTGNSSGWIPVSFSSASSENFKIYHDGWGDAYFSRSTAAVSLNTEYTLNNTGSNPNMTYSFVAGNYGIKITNPDVYNNMKMTIYRLFDANAVFYIDVSDYWSDDDPEIGGYFCESTSGTATWVRATRCADINNSHLYKLVAPSSAIYSKLVLGRFQKGTTAAQMGFSGTRFYNQSADILYQATNTKIKLTSYGSGSTTKATVSTSSITHTHTYYAYEYTRSTTSSSYSLVRTISSGTNVACDTSTISLSATDRSGSGYEFDGWYRGTSSGVSNATTLVSSNLSFTPTNYSGSSYYYAKYTLSSYAITYKADASPATATAGTITNPATNSVPTGDKKTHGQSYTITSNKFTRPGYTQVGWSTTANRTNTSGSGYYAFGATYSTNAALTLYPVWQLNTPTKAAGNASPPEIISTGSMTVGSTPVDLNLQVSSASADATRTYTYTITGPSGHNASVGTAPGTSSTFMKFTADIPGTYTVYITITDESATGVINSNSEATGITNTATISVLPDAPVINISLTGYVDDPLVVRDGTTSASAYMILLGEKYYFTASVDSDYLYYHPTTDYTYTWSKNAAFTDLISTDGTVTSFDINEDYEFITASPDNQSVHVESDGGIKHSITLYCRAERNGQSNDSSPTQLWYFVQPLIKSFVYEPLQKIYNMNDQLVSLAAQYNMSNNLDFTNVLKFSNDNYHWVDAATSSGFISSFVNPIKTYLYPNGPKFFYMQLTGPNAQGETITSVSDTIHTTVGSSDSSASRALYFTNSSSETLKNYLVMCYYIDGYGNLKYQAAQDLHKESDSDAGREYRVMVPSDADSVCFGIISETGNNVRYYGNPTVSGGVIGGFSAPIFQGFTDQVTLDSTVRRISTSTFTTVNSMWSFACTTGAY